VMADFGIYTSPALISIAFVVGLFSQTRFRSLMIQFAAITIIVFGGWTLMKAYMQFDYWINTSIEQQANDAKQMGKCGANKCGAGRCGMGTCGAQNSAKSTELPVKVEPMKCGSGKCGTQPVVKTEEKRLREETMKCGSGKCGSGKCGAQ
jgi:uncharacterized low-complexity protein